MRELFNTHCFERWKIQKSLLLLSESNKLINYFEINFIYIFFYYNYLIFLFIYL